MALLKTEPELGDLAGDKWRHYNVSARLNRSNRQWPNQKGLFF